MIRILDNTLLIDTILIECTNIPTFGENAYLSIVLYLDAMCRGLKIRDGHIPFFSWGPLTGPTLDSAMTVMFLATSRMQQ